MFYIRIGIVRIANHGGGMSTLRTVFIVSIIGVVAFGIAACGGNHKSPSTGPGGGDITVTATSFPDYVDPQLSYTLEGWEVL